MYLFIYIYIYICIYIHTCIYSYMYLTPPKVFFIRYTTLGFQVYEDLASVSTDHCWNMFERCGRPSAIRYDIAGSHWLWS